MTQTENRTKNRSLKSGFLSGAKGIRTLDLYNAIVALSQLSYGPTAESAKISAEWLQCQAAAATRLLPDRRLCLHDECIRLGRHQFGHRGSEVAGDPAGPCARDGWPTPGHATVATHATHRDCHRHRWRSPGRQAGAHRHRPRSEPAFPYMKPVSVGGSSISSISRPPASPVGVVRRMRRARSVRESALSRASS